MFLIGSPVVEVPMVVEENQDVVEGKPDEAVDSNVDPVEPIVVGKVVEDGLVENGLVEGLATAVVLVGSDKIKERLLTFINLEIIHYVLMIGSPVVEVPMVVDEIQDVVEGKPDVAVDSNVDPVEPIVVGKVVEDGLVENGSVVFLSSAVVLVGSDKIKERLLIFET